MAGFLQRQYNRAKRYATKDRYTLSRGVLDWLEQSLNAESSVLEFGSGSSTIFLAERVRKLVTVETDAHWYAQTQTRISKYNNTQLLRTRRSLQRGETFDIVIIDGGIRKRNLAHAINLFTQFLIFDDVHVPKWSRLSNVVSHHFEQEKTIWERPSLNRYLHRKTMIWSAQQKRHLELEQFRTRVCSNWRNLEMP